MSRSKLGPIPDSDWDQDIPARTPAELEAEAPGFDALMKDHLDKMRQVRGEAAAAKSKELTTKAFDESKVRRVRGGPGGGQFADKPDGVADKDTIPKEHLIRVEVAPGKWVTLDRRKLAGRSPREAALAVIREHDFDPSTIPSFGMDFPDEFMSTSLYDEKAMDEIRGESVKDLSRGEAAALKFYTTTAGYKSINAKLRGKSSELGRNVNEPDASKVERSIAQMDTAFGRTSLSEPMILYRGDASLSPAVGDEFTEKGYVSLASSPITAVSFSSDKNKVWQVRVPAGSKAIPLGSLPSRKFEGEVLLDRGTKFKVVGRNTLEVVNNGQKTDTKKAG